MWLLCLLDAYLSGSEQLSNKSTSSACTAGHLCIVLCFQVEQLDGLQHMHIPSGQQYKSPGEAYVEGDASSASYFLAGTANMCDHFADVSGHVIGMLQSCATGRAMFYVHCLAVFGLSTFRGFWSYGSQVTSISLLLHFKSLRHTPEVVSTLVLLQPLFMCTCAPCRLLACVALT